MVQMLYLGRNVVTEGYEKLLCSTIWTPYSINIAPGKRSYCYICTTGHLWRKAIQKGNRKHLKRRKYSTYLHWNRKYFYTISQELLKETRLNFYWLSCQHVCSRELYQQVLLLVTILLYINFMWPNPWKCTGWKNKISCNSTILTRFPSSMAYFYTKTSSIFHTRKVHYI